MKHFLLALIVLFGGLVAGRAFAGEEVSYTVSIDVKKALPASCGVAMTASPGLVISFGDFSDPLGNRQVATFKKGDTESPVYLDRPIAEVVKDGVHSTLELCGYKIATAKESKAVVLSAVVSDFSVQSEKKLITSKSGGGISVELKLATPDGRYRTFNVTLSNSDKGLRKKGISQVESTLAATYKAFLAQVAGLPDFRSALENFQGPPAG